MKKKILLGLAILMVFSMAAAPVFAKGHTIGVVIPYEIGWFAAYHRGYQIARTRKATSSFSRTTTTRLIRRPRPSRT